jgi:pimeloyl-ACP methyl ester carboxylesterase
MTLAHLQRPDAPALAYRNAPAAPDSALPDVLFCGGFGSDMEGTKAGFLAQCCASRGQGFVRFDYRGHGASEGLFQDGTIGLWLQDTLDIIDRVTQGKLILAGSSMGGWIGLLCALARPERVRGFIGLAAAPDFTRQILAGMNEAQRARLAADGYFELPHDYGDSPHVITKALLEDGERHCLLDAPIPLSIPVRLIYGMKDSEVPWQVAHRIAGAIPFPDKVVYLREEGDHRLSSPEDLALLDKMVVELSALVTGD